MQKHKDECLYGIFGGEYCCEMSALAFRAQEILQGYCAAPRRLHLQNVGVFCCYFIACIADGGSMLDLDEKQLRQEAMRAFRN